MKFGIFGLAKVLDEISQKNLVTVDLKKCMRFRNKSSGCSLCRDACPEGAIKLDDSDEIIKVDGFSCDGCGICVNACPNPVFFLVDAHHGSVMNKLKHRDNISISCPGSVCDLQVPCLGYINESILLSIAAEGIGIELNISGCKDCPKHGISDLAAGYADAVNSILQRCGSDKKVSVIDDGTSGVSGEGSLSRKLISLFGGKSREMSQSTTRQSLFIAALKKLGSLPHFEAGKIPFGNITLTASCNGCCLCAFLCPVEAISVNDDEKFILKFRPDLCTGCGQCVMICPQKAISLLAYIDLNDILPCEWKNIMEIEKQVCAGCGEFYVMSADARLCDLCRKDKEIEDSFFT